MATLLITILLMCVGFLLFLYLEARRRYTMAEKRTQLLFDNNVKLIQQNFELRTENKILSMPIAKMLDELID